MKTRENNKKISSLYLKQLNASLICSTNMKKAFICEIKHQIAELENQVQVFTMEDLHREIGSPDEIARSFESRDDIEKLKEKAKKYKKAKIVCWIALGLTILAITVSIIVVRSNKNYHSEINSNTYIKELK